MVRSLYTHKLFVLWFISQLTASCSNSPNQNMPQSVAARSPIKQSSKSTAVKFDQGGFQVSSADMNSRSALFPKTQTSPSEYIDSMNYVGPCRTKGCSVARTGGHNLHWYVTQAEGDTGRAYYVKGEDQRCWERLDWDNGAVRITYDNCWWTPGYKYSRYADGSWLARIWKPGDSIVADHTVFGGDWESCTDTPLGVGQKRVMTFLWRVKDFDWGAAGRLDTIAIRQSYPHEPNIREHYFYARGYGLIGWNYEDDSKPGDYKFNAFNLKSTVKPIPVGTKCVQVESVASAQPAASSMPLPSAASPTRPPTPSTMGPDPAKTPLPASAPTPQPQGALTACQVTQLPGGFEFQKNQPVYSCSKKYSLVFQQDGNLVLYDVETKRALWDSMTGQTGADSAVFQRDGNLVVYRTGSPLWNAKTGGSVGSQLVLQDDGNLLIRLNDSVVWSAMNLR